MGLKEAKVMIIIIGVLLIVTNLFASNISDLGNLKAVSGSVISDFYVIDPNSSGSGTLTGDGENFNSWVNQSDSGFEESTSVFDFAFKSWSWLVNGLKAIGKFIYAPYFLVDNWIKIDNMEDLSFVPILIGFIWTMGLTLTLFQIIWKE